MRVSILQAVLVMLLTLILSAVGMAAEVEDSETAVVDDVHRQVSRRLTDFIGQVDDFFGDDLALAQANESWARLRLDTIALENEDTEFKANVKLKLVLPSTERRLRVLLSTEEEDILDSDAQPSSRPQINDDNGNVKLALRFLRDIKENSGLKFDIGARVRDDEAQVFARIGAFIRRPVNENWTATLSNNAIYYSESGFDDQITLKFNRFLDRERKQYLLASTQLAWSEGNRGAGIAQRFGIYREVSPRTSIAMEVDINAITSPPEGRKRLREGELRFRLRQNIWRPWFFYELIPRINWPAESEYTGLYGGTVRVEVIFGHVN